MDNPIRYEDLFDKELIKAIGGLKKEISGVQQQLLDMIQKVKDTAKSLQNLPGKGGSSQQHKIAELEAAYDKLEFQLSETKKQLFELNDAGESMAFTQKQINAGVRASKDLNHALAGSYNQLSSEYRLLKVFINSLSKEERENNKEVQRMIAHSKELYEEMNRLQQQTGKHQLQVGNYSKAFNGLHLATQQVVREMPVLAQGFSMFIMAISNNLPILWDNIKTFKEEQEELAEKGEKTTSVFKAIVKSLVSWQTIMLVILTVLPSVIKKIKEKNEALKEQNEELKESITLEGTFFNVQKRTHEGYIQEAQKLKMLYRGVRDENRAVDDRNKLYKVLVDQYPEVFSKFTEEQIFLGKAQQAYDDLTNSLHKQAKAKAILNIATDNEKEKLEALMEIEKIQGDEKRKQQFIYLNSVTKELQEAEARVEDLKKRGVKGQELGIAIGDVKRLQKNLENQKEIMSDYFALKEKIAKADESNEWLYEKMLGKDFIELIKEGTSGGASGKVEKAIKNRDLEFVRAAEKARIEAMEEGKQKEIALIHNKYWVMREDLQNYLREQEKLPEKEREITKDGVDAINEQIKNLNLQEMRDLLALLGQAEDKSKKAKAGVASEKAVYKEHLDLLKKQWDTMNQQDIVRFKNDKREKRELLDNEIWYWQEYRKILEKYMPDGEEKDILLGNAMAHEESARTKKREVDPNTFMGWIGLWADENYEKKFEKGVERAYNIALDYMQKWMDARMEMAKAAVDAAQIEVDAAKEALDLEQQARVNGYAHNVGLARQEYEEKLALKQKALEEEQRIAAIQQKLDETQQISSLLVATANIWAAYTKGNIAGAVLAGLATAAMWGSFAAAKVQSAQLVKTKQYGEGMSEYLDYGGSHASGNDIDFGVMKDGTRRRVERGEMVAVINKKNVAKYGVDGVTDIVSSLNSGTFDEKYGLAFAGLGLMNASADLTKVEKGIDTLVSQGEKRIVQGNGCRVEYYKNRKRIIRN